MCRLRRQSLRKSPLRCGDAAACADGRVVSTSRSNRVLSQIPKNKNSLRAAYPTDSRPRSPRLAAFSKTHRENTVRDL